MAKEVVVTREGYNKLEQELENLRTVKRKEVADKIKVARGYGDLSENAEYDAAKEEQASVEARIADLEATLKLARIMDESELSNDTASIGMHVKILAEGDDLEDAEEYDLTGSTEADMDLNRISDESPVGAALIGCKVGDELDFGGLFGSGPVMKINRNSSSAFINRGGQIPAPLQSLKN